MTGMWLSGGAEEKHPAEWRTVPVGSGLLPAAFKNENIEQEQGCA